EGDAIAIPTTIQGQSVGIGCHLKSTVDRKRRFGRFKGWQNRCWDTLSFRPRYVRLLYAECPLLAPNVSLTSNSNCFPFLGSMQQTRAQPFRARMRTNQEMSNRKPTEHRGSASVQANMG